MSKPLSQLEVKLLTHTAVVPTRDSNAEAGFDVYADEDLTIPPLVENPDEARALVSTGIAIATPTGYYARVAPRSGLAVKQGIDVLAGVVDASYRGEVKIALVNLSGEPVDIKRGDRIAQLVVTAYYAGPAIVVDELSDTARGEKGFGSSGR